MLVLLKPRTHNPNQPDQSVQYASHPAARGALETLRDVTGSLAEELLTLQGVSDGTF